MVYPTGHVWFGVRVASGGKGKGKGEKGDFHSPTSPTPFLIFDRWPSTASLVQISFSPHRSAAVKNKDGGHKNSEHSPARITPALRANVTWNLFVK